MSSFFSEEFGETRMAESFRFLPKALIGATLRFFGRFSLVFVRLGVSPNTVTTLALVFGTLAGAAFALERPILAAVAIAVCGGLDILDGKIAVNSRRTSLFGAIYDSTLDRYSEFFMYLGLAVHFRRHWGLWLAFATFLGSTMVSYTRARAEGLGIECKVGIMQRAERVILLLAATVAGVVFHVLDPALLSALGLIALVSNITALQRVFHVRTMERRSRQQEVRS